MVLGTQRDDDPQVSAEGADVVQPVSLEHVLGAEPRKRFVGLAHGVLSGGADGEAKSERSAEQGRDSCGRSEPSPPTRTGVRSHVTPLFCRRDIHARLDQASRRLSAEYAGLLYFSIVASGAGGQARGSRGRG